MIKRKPKKRPQATRRREPKRIKVSWSSFASGGLSSVKKMPWHLLAWFVFVVVPLAVAIGVYNWIQNPKNLMITSIDVSGDLRVLDKTQLEPVIEPFINTNLYLLDVEGLEKAIENITWVNSASMTKIWPTKLVVKIFEQKPVAYWGDEKMLADNGEIIEGVLENRNDALPVLFSPRVKGKNLATNYLKVRHWMKGIPFKVVEFKEDTRGSWKVKLENGLTLKIGRNQQQKRIKRFMVGYEQRLADVIDKVKAVDLRYTNGFAVQWKKGLSADRVLNTPRKKKG